MRFGGKFTQYQNGYWLKILTFSVSSTSLSPSLTFSWIPSECNRGIWATFNINLRNGDTPIFYVNWLGSGTRTVKLVGDGSNFSVWISCSKNNYDGFGCIQIVHAYDVSNINYGGGWGSLGSQDEEPTGDFEKFPTLTGYVSRAAYVDWSGVENKPETATRWPSWSEVTSKPDTFAPSSHTHSYLPLSGGTLAGQGIVLLTINNTSNNATINGISFNLNGACQTRLVAQNGQIHRTDSTWSNQYTIWDSGNDGSGSGLDADKLDGYHISSILAGKESIAGGDANACTTMGSYWLGDGLGTNIPQTYDQVTTIHSGSTWGITQFASYNNKLHFRTSNYSSISWKNWREVAFTDSTVAAASSVPWSGITGKPSTFTPSDHEHNILKIASTSQDSAVPSTTSTYFKVFAVTDNTLSASTGDGYIMAFNYSSQYVTQIAVDLDPTYRLAIRNWKNDKGWNDWKNILTAENSSVGLSGNTLTVKINGSEKSLTNTWRGITDSYSGTDDTISLSQKGAKNLYDALSNGYASSSGSVGGYSVTSTSSFFYRYHYSCKLELNQITGNFWYVKVEMSRYWCPEVTRCLLQAAYSNIAGQVYLDITTLSGKWRTFSTSYCGNNIAGIKYISNVPNTFWIKLRKPVEYNGSIPDGEFHIYTQYTCTLTPQATDPDIIFTAIEGERYYDQDLFTDFSMNGNNTKLTVAGIEKELTIGYASSVPNLTNTEIDNIIV